MTSLSTKTLAYSSMDEGEGHRGRGERSKKRKMLEADRGSEEDKVEEFFALIRSTREARDRLRSSTTTKDHLLRDRRDDRIDQPSGVWNPTFRPEDFLDHRDDRDRDRDGDGDGDGDDRRPSDREDHALHLGGAGAIGGSGTSGLYPPKVDGETTGKEDKVGNDDISNLDLKLSL